LHRCPLSTPDQASGWAQPAWGKQVTRNSPLKKKGRNGRKKNEKETKEKPKSIEYSGTRAQKIFYPLGLKHPTPGGRITRQLGKTRQVRGDAMGRKGEREKAKGE
jgi:hypothetical protein